MATYTENYNLEKPAQSDLYNIDVFNENADKIDEALGDKAENQSLAPIESSATASRNYSVGQQFVYNGLLYEATSAIASGGTISPGSNCARTTVAEELSALNDSLTDIFAVKLHRIASIPVGAQGQLNLALNGYTVIGVRFQNADKVIAWGIGKDQTLYIKYNNDFTYQNIEVYAYYVKNDYLGTLS